MSGNSVRSAYNQGWHCGKYRSGWHAHRLVKDSAWTPQQIDAFWRGFNHGRQGLKADSQEDGVSELQAAMVAAQADMPKVKATGHNPHFHSTYVTLDDLLSSVLPVLNRHGLALSQFPISENGGKPALLTILMHASGENLQYVTPLLVVKQDMQALGSAITYARRYALTSALGIAEGEDDDGNGAVAGEVSPSSGAQGRAAPPPEPQSPPSRDVPGEDDLPDALKSDPTSPISEAQRTRLWTIASNKSMPEESVREIVRELTGQDSTRKIQRSEYQAVSDLVEAWQPPESELADKATRIQLTTLFREKGFTTAEQRKAYARQLLRKGEDFDSSQLTQTEAQFLITFLEAHDPPA